MTDRDWRWVGALIERVRRIDLYMQRSCVAVALTCEVGGSPSEPRSHDRGHVVPSRADQPRCGAALSDQEIGGGVRVQTVPMRSPPLAL